jgi:DNA-binding beta-propeller fold protein YncE
MKEKWNPKTIVSLVFLMCSGVCSLSVQGSTQLKLVAGTGLAGFKDGKSAELNKPIRLAPFTDNAVIFADINNHAIRIASLDGRVTTIAGGPDKKGHKDGPAKEARLNSPHGVAYDPETGDIFVAEAGNHVIRKISPDTEGHYVVSTFAGVAEEGGYKDGPLDKALFQSPHAIVLTPDKGIVVADIGNARIRLIKGGAVTTMAGGGESEQKECKPLEAKFKYPMDLVRDKETLLIADAGTHLVKKLLPTGMVATFESKTRLDTPHGIAVAESGMIFIANMGTHNILSIDKQGNVQSIAGTGEAGPELAQLNKPAAVLFHNDFLWIADLNNHQIKVLQITKSER